MSNPAALRLSRTLDAARDRYDAIVIGSGYGGGVAASRLARAGKRVCVIERGREFPTGSFPTRFSDLRGEMQVTGRRMRTGSPSALYDVRLGEDMHVLVGCGVGGGSLVNAGVALRPDRRVFEDAAWPDEIRADGLLDEGFRRAAEWIRPAPDPEAGAMTKFAALADAARGLGATPIAAPVTVSFAGGTNVAGIAQPACTRCGDCCGGCNVGAKNTVALTYLPDAVRHGAEIFREASARHVARSSDGTWQVQAERHDAEGRDAPARVLVADIVVVAAGTLGSTEILLRSREHGLALSERLGEGFSANGDIIAFGYGAERTVNAIGVGHPPRTDIGPIGASVSGQLELVDAADLASEIRVQEGAVPSVLAPMLPVLFLPNGRILGALQSLVSGVYKGPFAGLQTFFAVSHDRAAGRLSLDGDRLALSWPGAGDEPVLARLNTILGRLVGELGGRYVPNPLAGTVMGRQPSTAHPLGGARMGASHADGVVDHKCRVFDPLAGDGGTGVHCGLYVVDGSVIPRSLGVNPLLTITALAERTLLHLAHDHALAFDAAAVA